jgi:hypothetical protein
LGLHNILKIFISCFYTKYGASQTQNKNAQAILK